MATVAALIGSDLRGFDRFATRIDALLAERQPCDVFISTDAHSLACARRHRLLPRPTVISAAESPDTVEAIRQAFGPLGAGVSPHHLHQWWRLQHAWQLMSQHERQRGQVYDMVVRLRSDMRLPAPLPPLTGVGPHAIVMRGDWIFWGRRDAVGEAILGYVRALPLFHRLGQRAYLPLPYRHMALRVGAAGLGAGLLSWLRFPKQTAARPFGFSGNSAGSGGGFVAHVKEHLTALEAFEASGDGPRLRASDVFSPRDAWWRWDGIPDNEKYFFYHVLNSSLTPRSFLDLYNQHAPRDQQVSFLGKANGLLLPERHHPNCTCVCRVSR